MVNIVSLSHQDLGGLSYNLCDAINKHTGHQATQFVMQSTWLRYPTMLAGKKGVKETVGLIKQADVIHINEFISLFKTFNLTPENCKDKVIVFHAHGSRFRRDAGGILRWMRDNFPRAKLLASTPDMLQKFIPTGSWFPSIIPVEDYHKEYKIQGNDVPVVYNSATKPRKSRPSLKKVENALIHAGCKFSIHTPEKSRHSLNLDKKSQADIYFDGLRIFYGINAIEAGAFEMPVICGMNKFAENLLEEMGIKCKFKFFNLDDIASCNEEVKDLVSSKEYRVKVGRECYEYTKLMHSPEVCIPRFMELIE